jgi:hypothetical protein
MEAIMAKPALSVVPNNLPELTKRVKDGYAEIKRHEQDAVSKAMELGEIFLDMRDNKLKHGQFLNWIEKDCDLSIKTVERYITLHKNKNLLYSLDTGKLEVATINSALRQIEKLTGKKKSEKEEDDTKFSDACDTLSDRLIEKIGKIKNPEMAEITAQQAVNALNAALAEIKKKLLQKPADQKAA